MHAAKAQHIGQKACRGAGCGLHGSGCLFAIASRGNCAKLPCMHGVHHHSSNILCVPSSCRQKLLADQPAHFMHTFGTHMP